MHLASQHENCLLNTEGSWCDAAADHDNVSYTQPAGGWYFRRGYTIRRVESRVTRHDEWLPLDDITKLIHVHVAYNERILRVVCCVGALSIKVDIGLVFLDHYAGLSPKESGSNVRLVQNGIWTVVRRNHHVNVYSFYFHGLFKVLGCEHQKGAKLQRLKEWKLVTHTRPLMVWPSVNAISTQFWE